MSLLLEYESKYKTFEIFSRDPFHLVSYYVFSIKILKLPTDVKYFRLIAEKYLTIS
jgi:hypothetical protein